MTKTDITLDNGIQIIIPDTIPNHIELAKAWKNINHASRSIKSIMNGPVTSWFNQYGYCSDNEALDELKECQQH